MQFLKRVDFLTGMVSSLFFILVAGVALGQDYQEPVVHDDWTLEKDDDGVQVYVRWKEAEPGRKARQLRVEMIIESSLSAVVATIKDEKSMPLWVNRLKTYDIFNVTGNFDWNTYAEFQIPWPLNNQDLVTRTHLSQDKNSRALFLNIVGEPDKIPVKKNIDRIPHFEGSWDFIPLEHGKVKLVYKLFTGQKPFLPRWIIDPIIEYGIWKTLIDMKKVILEKNQSGVRLDYIID